MNIVEWRKARGVTQDQLAESVGTSRPHLSKVERGAAEPSPDLARRIERFTRGEVTAASLLGVSERPRPARGVKENADQFAHLETLTIDVPLAARTRESMQAAKIDVAAVARAGAEKALKEAEAKAWGVANREAIAAYNAWIKKHGTLAEQLGLI